VFNQSLDVLTAVEFAANCREGGLDQTRSRFTIRRTAQITVHVTPESAVGYRR
jgi:hypothetical protein